MFLAQGIGGIGISIQKQSAETRLAGDLNKVPTNLHHVHLMGICGTAMASMAGMLKEKGFLVTGSDQNVYPPMSHFLESLSIPMIEGYSAENLIPKPDLVIVGNVITNDNPEAIELSRQKLPYISFPQALKHFAFKGKRTIVISGTHGKTTTSALVAWILERAGMNPGFMIGGIPLNFQTNFKLAEGRYFVIEGDEYDTAFFDKRPKFLHYDPWATILTNIEFDHSDIFRDLDHVVGFFRKLIDMSPIDGILVANGDDPVIAGAISRARCRTVTYSLSENGLWRAIETTTQQELTRFKVIKEGEEYMTLFTPMYGHHNLYNVLSAVVLADLLEIPSNIISQSVMSFLGVRRRQENIGEKRGILILDDFAHHPTAVRETIGAVREKYKGRRLITVFEPRSNSTRRNVFQARYASSFDDSDLVMIPEPPLMEKIPPHERFSSQRLVEDLEARALKSL
ncbi:MAG: Mur ligase family protein, partial [Thermodesulfobacteriota bacterium]|nr:Mur ligase family protein [Thermodesulfobacteriota bacterium]